MNENLKLKNQSDYAKEFIYKVGRDENIYSIAQKFSTTVRFLIGLNGLTEEPTRGQSILVGKIQGSLYVVKPKDTLESICGGDKEKMMSVMNKNMTDELYVGQIIYI